MAKLILGIAGEMGSGKGAVVKYAVETYGAGSHKFSQIIRNILDCIHVNQSRENFSNLSLALRKNFGEDILAKSIYHNVENDAHEVIVIDGVRRMEDIVYLRQLSEFKLAYIEADMYVRYERLIARGENEGDTTKTFDQFKLDHEHDSDARIKDLKNFADYVIDNNKTAEELNKQIDEIVKQYIV